MTRPRQRGWLLWMTDCGRINTWGKPMGGKNCINKVCSVDPLAAVSGLIRIFSD